MLAVLVTIFSIFGWTTALTGANFGEYHGIARWIWLAVFAVCAIIALIFVIKEVKTRDKAAKTLPARWDWLDVVSTVGGMLVFGFCAWQLTRYFLGEIGHGLLPPIVLSIGILWLPLEARIKYTELTHP